MSMDRTSACVLSRSAVRRVEELRAMPKVVATRTTPTARAIAAASSAAPHALGALAKVVGDH